jgi:DNA repair exonuclease SbcCD ATPase subunit
MKNEKNETYMVNSKETLIIPKNAKIRVYWSDAPENYSREAKNRVQKYFSKKYGVDKNNIQVEYKPVKIGKNGKLIQIDGASIDNIMDTAYQRELFKEWLSRNNKTIDINRIYSLDDKVNAELNENIEEVNQKRWNLKWITLNNFLSFGENNFLPISRFKGLTVVNSTPENTGGKTTLVVDSMKYLLFGRTTKTDKNEDIFNLHSENNELVVRGMIEVEGDSEIIIERNMRRTKNKSGGWTIKNVVNYYKILPDGEEELLNDEDAIKTTQRIKSIVGSEKDFELVVLATARNLDDLIDFSSGESGKLLTRFIGLDVIEKKEEIARGMYNTFSKTMKSNLYDVVTLSDEIETHKGNIIKLKDDEIDLNNKLNIEKQSIIDLTNDKLTLVGNKIKVDVEILTLNPSKLEKDIQTITETGIKYKKEIDDIDIRIKEIGKLVFDEDRHFEITKEVNTLTTNIAVKNAEMIRLKNVIDDLIAGGICKACNRKLDDVDNTKHIEEHESSIKGIENDVTKLNKKLTKLNNELISLNETKKLVDEVNKLELNKDKLEVELTSLRNDIKIKKSDLKKYNENLNAIETNKDIDVNISQIDTKLSVCDNQKTEINNKLQRVILDTENNSKDIEVKTKLIEQIKKEKEVETIYKLYIDIVGKKGISKLVLRSVLPIINSELQRLLEDVTDFDIEIFIDDKNEVKYLLIKDGIEKQLKSGSGFERTAASLALRCVLGKMSKLSMPNFITLDEVLGRVAPNNIEKMKVLFDKIKDMYENIFFITQNEIIKDWSDNIITVVKENNISKININ